MTIEALKGIVEAERTLLKAKPGKACQFTAPGPVGIRIIDELVKVIEEQQKRIEKLERDTKSAV